MTIQSLPNLYLLHDLSDFSHFVKSGNLECGYVLLSFLHQLRIARSVHSKFVRQPSQLWSEVEFHFDHFDTIDIYYDALFFFPEDGSRKESANIPYELTELWNRDWSARAWEA